MTKKEVLASTTFGKRIAEDEAEVLASYFVETDQWRKVFSGDADVVYGPKGSGKSAIYSLLRKKLPELKDKGIILAAGENVRGTPAFEDLVSDPPASEEQFRGLWKVYFLSLIGTAFRIVKVANEPARRLSHALEEVGLVASEWSLRAMLRSALDYVRRIDGVAGEVKIDPKSPFQGRHRMCAALRAHFVSRFNTQRSRAGLTQMSP